MIGCITDSRQTPVENSLHYTAMYTTLTCTLLCCTLLDCTFLDCIFLDSWLYFSTLYCTVPYMYCFLLGGEVSQKIDRFAAAGMLASQMEINRGSAVHTQPHCVLLHAVLSWVRTIWACMQCILGCSVFWPAVYFGLHICSLGWGLFEPAYNVF